MLTINVTQDDIDKGTRGDGASCPVAIAIHRRCPTVYADILVDGQHIKIDSDAEDFYFKLDIPKKVRNFTAKFDQQGPAEVTPFSFKLDLPEDQFLPEPPKPTWQDLKINTPYEVKYLTVSNDKRKPHKSKLHGRTVVIKENDPTNSNIPSFEHGFVHTYDATTNEYLGSSGIFYFARSVGMMGD